MIIPSSSFASVSFIKNSSAAAASDVTPAAVNWADVTYHDMSGSIGITSRLITAINQTITLRVAYTPLRSNELFLYYRKSGSGGSDSTGTDYSDLPSFTLINTNGTFTVTTDQYVDFTSYYGSSWIGSPLSATVTVTNVTDSNAVLDTFTIAVSGS